MKYDPTKLGPRYKLGSRASVAYVIQNRLLTPKEFWAYVAKLLSVD